MKAKHIIIIVVIIIIIWFLFFKKKDYPVVGGTASLGPNQNSVRNGAIHLAHSSGAIS